MDDAKQYDNQCVYGLLDANLDIFYVGKTKALKKRIKAHLNYCHNKTLGAYITDNGIHGVELLSDNPDDEMYFIDKHKDKSMNIIDSTFNNTMLTKISKPWMAGTGIKCPSDYIMWNVAKNEKNKIKNLFPEVLKLRNKMSDTERCVYEISVYKDCIHDLVKPSLKKWVDLTLDRMITQMETLGA